MKFVGVEQITDKNVKESNPTHANQILLSLNNWPIIYWPKQYPPFLIHSFKWNQTTMRSKYISRLLIANYVYITFIDCFYDP